MRRSLGYRTRPPKSRKPIETLPREFFRSTVFHRAEGRSQLTGATEFPMDAHHCVSQQLLKRIAPELLWDADNGILLTRLEHTRHENRGTVISYEQLPEYVKRWAATHDLTMFLERSHPRRKPQKEEETNLNEAA